MCVYIVEARSENFNLPLSPVRKRESTDTVTHLSKLWDLHNTEDSGDPFDRKPPAQSITKLSAIRLVRICFSVWLFMKSYESWNRNF